MHACVLYTSAHVTFLAVQWANTIRSTLSEIMQMHSVPHCNSSDHLFPSKLLFTLFTLRSVSDSTLLPALFTVSVLGWSFMFSFVLFKFTPAVLFNAAAAIYMFVIVSWTFPVKCDNLLNKDETKYCTFLLSVQYILTNIKLPLGLIAIVFVLCVCPQY